MKAKVIAGLAITIQIIFAPAAFCDSQEDAKWASGRDPVADFCNNISHSFTGLTKLVGGDTNAADGDAAAWGTRRGGWDIAPATNVGGGITVIESSKKILESKNVQIKSGDGSRMIRRFGPNDKASAVAPLKKMIDSGSSSYNLGSYGASRYYPMGQGTASGYRSGGGGSRGGWGGYSDSASANAYGNYSPYGFGASAAGGGHGGYGSRPAVGSSFGGASRSF